jgi:hypothetical protein
MGWPSRPDHSDLILENITPCYLGAGGQDGGVGPAELITLI